MHEPRQHEIICVLTAGIELKRQILIGLEAYSLSFTPCFLHLSQGPPLPETENQLEALCLRNSL